jgi:16S rRNA processing protein RimM
LPSPLLPPERLVVMGRVVAPFGVKGWMKVQSFAAEPGALPAQSRWWLHLRDGWKEFSVPEARVHGVGVVAKVEGFETPEAVAALGRVDVAVPRDSLPPAPEGEYYWFDLVGVRVENLSGETLGVVATVMDNGAQSVLEVEGDRRQLIPFVDPILRRVDLGTGVIVVDWGSDY